MVKESFSKLVSTAKKATASSSKVISKVSAKSSEVIKNSSKATSEVAKKLKECCNPTNLIPCITAIVLIIYIVVVNPDTVLDIFSTRVGKLVSMSIVLIALLFDVRLGVMLGLAVVLSVNMASANRDMYESYTVEPINPEDDDEMLYEDEDVNEVADENIYKPQVKEPEEIENVELTGFDAEPQYAMLTDDSNNMS